MGVGWYYMASGWIRKNRRVGPISEADLLSQISKGKISSSYGSKSILQRKRLISWWSLGLRCSGSLRYSEEFFPRIFFQCSGKGTFATSFSGLILGLQKIIVLGTWRICSCLMSRSCWIESGTGSSGARIAVSKPANISDQNINCLRHPQAPKPMMTAPGKKHILMPWNPAPIVPMENPKKPTTENTLPNMHSRQITPVLNRPFRVLLFFLIDSTS